MLFDWLGTAVHETGHPLFCLLFGHRITGIKRFASGPRSRTESAALV